MSPEQQNPSLSAQPLLVSGVEFRVAPLGGHAHPDHLVIVKPRSVIDEYLQLLSNLEAPRLVELGIAYGGSVGLFAVAARPTRMVAVDLSPHPVRLLEEVLEAAGLSDAVTLHWGTDQSDQRLLRTIVDDAFGVEPLDLVIDDASHLYGPTVASFEVLFPRLRPGARYLIEDWSCDHDLRALVAAAYSDPASPYHAWSEQVMAGALSSSNPGEPGQTDVAVTAVRKGLGLDPGPSATPLSRLALELTHGVPEPSSGIKSVKTGTFWIEIERDDVELSDDYSLREACPDHFATLQPMRGTGSSD